MVSLTFLLLHTPSKCLEAVAQVPTRQEAQTKNTAADGAVSPKVGDEFPRQRAVADEVLHRPEFQRNVSQTWWEQKKRELLRLLEKIFGQVGRLGHASPRLVRALEWGLFIGAALGLFIFLLRQMARQRLHVDLGTGGIKPEVWSREANDWQQRAEAFAASGAWRDAVHCLYWAAIVLLESRKAWRHNPTRTPREYVRLLKPGSAQQDSLRGITQLFEHTWYGLRQTTADEYARARELYNGLISPRLQIRQDLNEGLEADQL